MTQGKRKLVMGIEVGLLLAPLTLFMALLVPLTYAAYPMPDPRPILIVFDAGMLMKSAGIVAAWRLTIRYLRFGSRGIREVHLAWLAVLAVAVSIGLVCTVIAVEQNFMSNLYQERIGFTLLAPALLLAPIFLHLSRERCRG